MTYTLLSGHDASAHQAAIFDAMRDPRSGSKSIIAVAGAGKTTSIKNALCYLPAGTSVQGLAFNKEAAKSLKDALEEVRTKLGDQHVRAMRMGTFHSVCFQALLKYFNCRATSCEPQKNKCRDLLKRRLGEDEYELYSSFVVKLVGLAKGEGIGALVPDTEERWYDIVDHHGLYLDSDEATTERAIEIARKLLIYSNKMAKEQKLIDYDDQLYLVILWGIQLWQNDVVFVDEAQDTNPVRRAIVRLLLKRGGRVFAVGDPMQSIYGFTGASTDAMDLIAREFNTTELPLTVSYRCARSVVARAQEWVPYIEASDFAPEGRCEFGVELKNALVDLTDDDAVLCRQTAPLVGLAYKLIGQGRGARVLGKEIGEGLINLVKLQKAKGIDALREKLDDWCEREAARFIAKGEEERAEGVRDRVACIVTFIDNLPENGRTIPNLIRRIDALFEDKGGRVLTLSTVHKAKGQEWNTVAILSPELMPSQAARQEWQMEQEKNLMYVAATRAKTNLLYLAE